MATPKTKKSESQPHPTVQNFPIVGIGASAGGLEAFKKLLGAITENSGMAYVLVQHLDPNHESLLPEILQRVTKIPVLEITDDIPLAPNHIYIIPSNKMLTSTDGVLKLSNREKKVNLSIDVFFSSLADVHKELAIGVILSGTGSDGTIGLKAIKDHGGISIAQDFESATYDSMPQNAVNAGIVDFILTPENIPEQLLNIYNTYKTVNLYRSEEEIPKDDEAVFKQILMLLRLRSGVDFTNYKQSTFHRRIARRITIAKKKNLKDYLKLLRSDKAEQDALFQDVLIPVTCFFRDPKTFLALTQIVFPAIIKNEPSDLPIRIWIAGCSTGEEAFSVAICLHEFLTEKQLNRKIQIFASDISEKAIKKARTAIYTKTDLEKISEIQLNNYFVKSNGSFEVKKLIRDMCVFAPHNFLKDPPFAKMDLISCRNVLIYMDNFLQKKAFTTFHYALKETGFLLLGKSESIGSSSDLFLQVNKNEKIYSSKPSSGRFTHIATDKLNKYTNVDLKTQSFKQDLKPTSTDGLLDFRKSAEAIMILKSPASVVVNEQMDIVHVHGDITPFLQTPQGKPTHNLIKMAREGLAFELRNAIHKATKEKNSVVKENIPIKINDIQSLISIEVIPLTDMTEIHHLIRFEKKNIPDEIHINLPKSGKTIETLKQNQHLENELSQTREDMRFITEDMEAANEELQSANEELQSSNEEMQSLNEELETSKEELQSTNEELTIVNQELHDKQEQLNAANYYAESIVTTIREPLIVLDRALRIKTANASFYKKFKTEENTTEGEFFYEIQNKQWDDTLMRSLLERILPQHERLEDFEIMINFPLLGECHLLLNALQIKNDVTSEQLILLAIEDITERKIAEQKLEATVVELAEKNKLIEETESAQLKLVQHLKLATDSANLGTWSLDIKTQELDWSLLHKKMWGFDEKIGAITFEDWYKLIIAEDLALTFERIENAKANKCFYDVEYRIKRANDSVIIWIKSIGQYHYDKNGEAQTFTGISIDISEQKRIEEELLEAKTKAEWAKEKAEHAVMAKQQFLSNMSHEIRTPMNAIVGFTKVLLKSDINEKQKEYLQAINSSGKTLIVLIDDILDLAKVDAGKMIFVNEPFRIADSITTILHLFETKIQESGLELIKEYDAKIPDVILGDSVRLHQILINLLSNAIKFTAKGKIVVSVALIDEKDENITIEVKVADTGIGISQHKIVAIFENFEQAENTTSSLYGGTGLGLAIVKKLTEKQGGTISVESKINEGSTFSFRLSYQKTNIQLVKNELEQKHITTNQLKILVVEDVKLNQLLMRTILDDFDFKWEMADNGKIAIDKLQNESFDIILMDLQMPIMNGFEATAYIRNTLKLTIPIIALTADVTTVDVEKCKIAGMNDYISKPLDEKLLYKKIVDLVKKT